MVKVNGDESYLGKDIREWCTQNSEDPDAIGVWDAYYSDNAKHEPSDKVYYFVYYVSTGQAYKESRNLMRTGYFLCRDLDKSPRKTR